MLNITVFPEGRPAFTWLADESPLNDLDEADSEITPDGAEELPDEVVEQLEKAPPPPDPIPDPGVM